MPYKLLYGDDILFDPYVDDEIYDLSLTEEKNACAYLDFTVASNHELYDEIKEKDKFVTLYFDDEKLFVGYVTEIEKDFYNNKEVSCVSVLAFLDSVMTRPYSSIEEKQPVTAPTSIDGYFQWLIDQYNERRLGYNVEFRVGANQGSSFSDVDYVEFENSSMSTIASQITDNILDTYGGFLTLDYVGEQFVLNLYSDTHEANSQIIDFGVNITDFTRTDSTDDQYTAVRPTGKSNTEDGKTTYVTIESLGDGVTSEDSDIYKIGDVLYSLSGVQRYGYKEYEYSDSNIENPEELMRLAIVDLRKNKDVKTTIDIKAVDLALFMEGYTHLKTGQVVRVRSNPHGVDEYLMVSSINVDLQDPGNSEYTLGDTYDTLTGRQSAYVKSLNQGINSAVDMVGPISDEAKNAAKDAEEAKEAAANAVVSTVEQFYQSNSPTELSGGSWELTNIWIDGKYTWRRTLVTYGNGSQEYTPSENGICISGNTGPQGPQGAQGLQGLQGPQGEQGIPGPQGDTGAQGPKGDKGDTGAQGPQGETGPQGNPGQDGKTSYFHIKYSPIPNPSSSSDISETPDTYIGTYVDFVQQDSTDPNDYTWSRFEGIPGDQGIPGTNGEDGKTSYLHIAYANSADGNADFSVEDSTNKLYIGQYTDFNPGDSTDPSSYSWTKIKGDTGAQGPQGETGPQGEQGATGPQGPQGEQGPQGDKGDTGAQGPQGPQGDKGDTGATGPRGPQGEQGPQGATGVGISSITEYYAISSSNSTAPSSGWSTTVPTMTTTNRYLWNYEVIKYTNSTTSQSSKRVIGVYGNTGATGPQGPQGDKGDTGAQGPQGNIGATGVGIKSITNHYLASASSSGVTTSTSGWTTTIQSTSTSKRYLWNYETITYTNNSTTNTTPVIIGTHGATGATGPQGPQGEQGPQGDKGDTGAQGPQGPQGDKGDTGATGPRGPQGKPGADGEDGQMLYATSDTAAGTAAKVATLSSGNLTLKSGVTVAVKFTNNNTANSPTLNVAGTGARAIYTSGVRAAYWQAGATVIFVYNGSYWYSASEPIYASTATIGNPAGSNIYLDGSAVNIRTGSTVNTRITDEVIELGSNSKSSVITMCGDAFVASVLEGDTEYTPDMAVLRSSEGMRVQASAGTDTSGSDAGMEAFRDISFNDNSSAALYSSSWNPDLTTNDARVEVTSSSDDSSGISGMSRIELTADEVFANGFGIINAEWRFAEKDYNEDGNWTPATSITGWYPRAIPLKIFGTSNWNDFFDIVRNPSDAFESTSTAISEIVFKKSGFYKISIQVTVGTANYRNVVGIFAKNKSTGNYDELATSGAHSGSASDYSTSTSAIIDTERFSSAIGANFLSGGAKKFRLKGNLTFVDIQYLGGVTYI